MTDMFVATASWLRERIRYLAMWPINLVRDFPVRAARLLRTIYQLPVACIFLLPEVLDAWRHHELQTWLRYKMGRAIQWLHKIAAQLFDLAGGPEIAQFLLHFFTVTTPLTDTEIAMMSAIIGPDALRYKEVRVAQGGLLGWLFRLNGNLAFATWHTINMPRDGRHKRQNRPIVAHELTHVYQYEQIGSRYLGEAIYMLIKTKRDCYDYGGRTGLEYACLTGGHYSDYNREQQAMIVQDYYFLQHQGADTSAYLPYIEELRAGLI